MVIKKWYWGVFVIAMMHYAMTGTEGWNKYTISGYAQGTDYTVTYYAADSLISRPEIDSLLAEIDSSMSLYKPYSLISKINKGGKGTFYIDKHFGRVGRKSLEIYWQSNGLFDVTVAPLVQLWGFGVGKVDRLPDSTEVRRARACVGMDKIRLGDTVLEKRYSCTQLDFNGIAQGYSVDVLADFLAGRGINSYVVELGGELRVKGPKPDGTPVLIGIERPVKGGGMSPIMNTIIEVSEGAVTTAGNYRKFITDGEQLISHHINPETGYPFQTGTISATVYAADAMTADGYDNVVMAMSAKDAIAFVNKLRDIEVYLIYKDPSGAIRDTMSSGFGQLISEH